MNRSEWQAELKFFIEPHPTLYPDAGDIYVPVQRFLLTFQFCNGENIAGVAHNLQINFNSETFIIFALGVSRSPSVHRYLWESLIGFRIESVSGIDSGDSWPWPPRFSLN